MKKNMSTFIQDGCNWVFKNCTKDLGSTLIWTTCIGWASSSIAQIIGIATNSKYTKKQKSFMIPQEIFDALINIGTFLIITYPLKRFSNKLVKTGKFIPKSVKDCIIGHKDASKIGNMNFDISQLDYMFDKNNQAGKAYNSWYNFVTTTATVGGSILSSNIITPILRNKYAANHKLRITELEHTNIDNTKKSYNNSNSSPFDNFHKSGMRV